ncbi:MAG: arsenite efflux transporter metallochaperone ArsD [Thermodesulfobacteriota bacterium]|jgi:hypothetical protein|nr:MAG: arsenite efflux transporter metallochaperone ArsD [Thermodesulfobacteriota bacterium]
MQQTKLQVYDPPMCCSSVVCGPKVDPDLVRFSSDLDWLRKKGVVVERFNLSSHTAEFAREERVAEALNREGNKCLPLILVDGVIVSRGSYPLRGELLQFIGIDKVVTAEHSPINSPPSPLEPQSGMNSCGPGCACNAPPKAKGIKVAVSLIVLLVVIGILIFKTSVTKGKSSNDLAAAKTSGFTVAPKAPEPVTDSATQPLNGDKAEMPVKNEITETSKVVDQKPIENKKEKKIEKVELKNSKAVPKIGEYLESLSDLNKVALSQDAVFIFIPREKDEAVKDQTKDAVLSAQKTLKTNKINLGIYTLPVSSPDYSKISTQVQAPAILVASKGKGMAAVTGDVTESKLLQAFTATSRAGGCGPSSCAPSSGCN